MIKPDTIDDVWPHEEMVMAVTESRECFGDTVDTTLSDIISNNHLTGEDSHNPTDLSAHYSCLDFEEIDDGLDLIPNSLLIVEHTILEKGFLSYLDSTTIPSSTWIVIYVDGDNPEERKSEIERRAKRSVEAVTNRDVLLATAKLYFRTICPICSGDSARDYVLNWSLAVYHRVEN